jgi:7-cyano-7-deazaguanine synthase in queuosine biosynthesis
MIGSRLHIGVRWESEEPVRCSEIDCVIQRDFKIDPADLQDFSARMLRPVEQDLVVIAGAIAYADRVVRRRRGQGWSRNLTLTIPVSDPLHWTKGAVSKTLIDAIEYVTGDVWSFAFVQGPAISLITQQSSMDFTRGNYIVMPFSDGMDSFLQWQLLKKEEIHSNVLRVHTHSRASNRRRNKLIDLARDWSDQRLAMPVSLSKLSHPEPTYRSRTFLFFSIAALAASKVGTSRIVVGENGVGTYGPGMVPFGDEYPHRTSHPAFTSRLAVFINAALDANVSFEHPQQFWTKGQVLKHAINLGVSGWEHTHSCTRSARNQLDGLPCGICGGCLLRRTAVHHAGLHDSRYFWDNLSAVELDDCRSDPNGRLATKSDREIARHGILDMDSFAALGVQQNSREIFERAAWEVIEEIGPAYTDVSEKIAFLARNHASEWSSFRRRFAGGGILSTDQEQ